MDDEPLTAEAENEEIVDTAPVSGEEVEREISELTEDLAAAKPAEAPQPKPEQQPSFWRSWPVAAVALAVAVVMTVANLAGLGPWARGPEPLTNPEQQRLSELELLALVGYIEDYRDQHGRLPGTIDVLEIDFGTAVAEYDRVDETDFVVAISRGDIRRTFDSRLEPDEPPPTS